MPDTPPTGRAIGVDVGLIDFLATSDGLRIQRPKFFVELQRELKLLRQKAESWRCRFPESVSPGEGLTAVVDRSVYTQGAVFVGLPLRLYARGWLRGSPAQFIRPAPPRVSPGVYTGCSRQTFQ